MLKKTAAFGSLLTVLYASSTLAHGPNFKSGFLAGAHVGYSFGSGKFTGTLDLVPALAPSSIITGSARKSAFLFGVLGGYRHIFNDGYTIGANLEVDIYGSNEVTKRLEQPPAPVVPFNNRLKRNYSVIPSMTLGKIFCGRYHVALGLGLGITRFNLQVDNILQQRSQSASQTKLGFVPSIGVEYAATHNVSLVGNISYEMYKKISKKFVNILNAGAVTANYTSSISPKYVNLKLGVVYRF